ncbi:hypothetical protein N7492_005180 [Penicillium capsulatum]|uniref:Uncharacterized protein n=1 Tax=Penicillium capsulatum TaxID=69766 RepID=A0A9W9LQX0_9EURO|nr:hypothetical protein N7492_005180 [Penicillium capsulatum]KAJ6135715.1 hypothetical protein N7512_000875 [Penicillium capsulatum]
MDSRKVKSFSQITQGLLGMISDALIADRDPTGPIAPGQLAHWKRILKLTYNNVSTDTQASALMDTLTRGIHKLLQTFLENELLEGLWAAIYARAEEGSIVVIARLMLLRLEETLADDVWVNAPSYDAILSQIAQDITPEDLDSEVESIQFLVPEHGMYPSEV